MKLYWKVGQLPSKIKPGDRAYCALGNIILGYHLITGIRLRKFAWTCKITGRRWLPGSYIVRQASSWIPHRDADSPGPIPRRGWCYAQWESNGVETASVPAGLPEKVEDQLRGSKEDIPGFDPTLATLLLNFYPTRKYPQRGLQCGDCSYCQEGVCRVRILQGQPEKEALTDPLDICSEWGSPITH